MEPWGIPEIIWKKVNLENRYMIKLANASAFFFLSNFEVMNNLSAAHKLAVKEFRSVFWDSSIPGMRRLR